MCMRDLIEKLMHREVLKIVAEEQADGVLQPHTPEVKKQKQEAGVQKAMQILGPEGVEKIKRIIRTIALKPLLDRDLGELIDDEVWREAIDAGLYPGDFDTADDDTISDYDTVIANVMLSYLHKIRDAAEEILDA